MRLSPDGRNLRPLLNGSKNEEDNGREARKGGMMQYLAKGSSSSSSRSSSGSKSSSSSKSSTSKSTPKTATPSKPKASTKPSAGSRVTDGSRPKAVTGTNKKYGDGHRVSDTYQPRFNGYTAPPGSVVYYPQHSPLDYLPWIFLFSQSSPSHDQAMVVQPDGKQVVAEPPKGVDGMVIFNWFIIIVFLALLLGGIVWLVNKKTQPKKGLAYA